MSPPCGKRNVSTLVPGAYGHFPCAAGASPRSYGAKTEGHVILSERSESKDLSGAIDDLSTPKPR